MASLLLASGAKELRHALPHSRIMVHQPHGGASVRRSLYLKTCVLKKIILSRVKKLPIVVYN